MKTYIVDAFTDAPFKGNPAGVCLIDAPLSAELMLSIAQELNLSETAFAHRIGTGEHYSIRFFSPKMEIPLCGHATLAAAKVLFDIFKINDVSFTTHADLNLEAKRVDDQIEMVFPVYDTVPADAPSALLGALGIDTVINCVFNEETKILLLEIADPATLAELQPDFRALVRSYDGINGVLVTSRSDSENYDFHSRFFWPWSGSDEDPVTGGSHTFLAKYWSIRLDKSEMRSFQSSKRTGSMDVSLIDDKLLIRSRAIIVFEGNLLV
jgi:PhzF family phenazine biosynthesis protein